MHQCARNWGSKRENTPCEHAGAVRSWSRITSTPRRSVAACMAAGFAAQSRPDAATTPPLLAFANVMRLDCFRAGKLTYAVMGVNDVKACLNLSL